MEAPHGVANLRDAIVAMDIARARKLVLALLTGIDLHIALLLLPKQRELIPNGLRGDLMKWRAFRRPCAGPQSDCDTD